MPDFLSNFRFGKKNNSSISSKITSYFIQKNTSTYLQTTQHEVGHKNSSNGLEIQISYVKCSLNSSGL